MSTLPSLKSPQKRPLSVRDDSAQPAKKPRHFYHRHHALKYPQQTLVGAEPALVGQFSDLSSSTPDGAAAAFPLSQAQVDVFLDQAIALICKQVGQREGIADMGMESWAMERLRSAAEAHALELCKYVRRSMLAARRTAPTATDFESAFQVLSVPIPEDQLPPLLRTSPKAAPVFLPTPPPEEFFNNHQLPESLLGPDLSAQTSAARKPYIPSTLPAFPSQHTFRNTSSVAPRLMDPRKVREQVAKEGKLGEEALRRLAGGASRGDDKLDFASKGAGEAEDRPRHATGHAGRRKDKESPQPTMEEAFDAAMKAALEQRGMGPGTEAGKAFQMAPIVNSERKFWMPEGGRRKAVSVAAKDGAGPPPPAQAPPQQNPT